METVPPFSCRRNVELAKILKTLLNPNFEVGNSTVLSKFFNHVVKENDISSEPNAGKLISKEYGNEFCQWLIEASDMWEKQGVKPPNTILSFALNLASVLSKDEQIFVQLNCQNVFESLVGVAQKEAGDNVTLGLVTLLCSFVEHKSGLQWILATTYWTDIVKLGRRSYTIDIRRKTYEFVTKLLQRTLSVNRNFCRNLVAMLITPFQDALKKCSQSATSNEPMQIQDQKVFDSLKPCLNFINEVAEALIKSSEHAALNIFLELRAHEMIVKLISLSQIEDLSFELLKIQCIFMFYKITSDTGCHTMVGKQVDSAKGSQPKGMLDIIWEEICREHIRCVIKLYHYAHMLFGNISTQFPCITRKGPLEFQNQLLLLQLMPILIFLSEKTGCKIEDTLDDVYRSDFIHKLLKISTYRIIEIVFRWKEGLLAKPNLIEYLTFSLVYLMKTKEALNKERAAIAFQPLVYSLKKNLSIIEVQQHVELSPSYDLFLNTLIDAIIDLVQTFDLTWRDSIATISVMSIALEFLQLPYWNDKLIISGLMLLNLAISKYMSPDMVLLMDNSKDTLVSLTGSMLYTKCQENIWELRNAALENVYSLSLNANSKFPSYTNILLEAELPQLAVRMSFQDQEYFVRATAFRCLQELIQIQEVWDIFIELDSFLDNILSALEHESEGMVQKEIAKLIFLIYKFQSFPANLLPRLYDVMTHAASNEMCGEVRFPALIFWFIVFETHLNNQGMLDREFPEVTFSKEQRKIVTLNEAEVRKRLIKVLNQMSRIGCLHVLKNACLDDRQEVWKKAIQGTLMIVKMLKLYKVPCENVDLSEPHDTLPPHQDVQKELRVPSPASSITLTASECGDIECDELVESTDHFSSVPGASFKLDLFSLHQPDSGASQSYLQYTWSHKSSSDSAISSSHDQATSFSSVGQTGTSIEPSSGECDVDMFEDKEKDQAEYSLDESTDLFSSVLSASLNLDLFSPEQPASDTSQSHLQCSWSQKSSSHDQTTPNSVSQTASIEPSTKKSDVDIFEDKGKDQAEYSTRLSYLDQIQVESIMKDLLSSSEMTVGHQIYNPISQVKSRTKPMKKCTYLAPSEYLKFAYQLKEKPAEKVQQLDSLDRFNSLLDNVLKEYSVMLETDSIDYR